MQKNEVKKSSVISYIVGYVCILLAVVFTPIIIRPLGEIFHGVTLTQWDKEKGKLCSFFADILTVIVWLIEFLLLYLLYRSFKKEGKAANFLKTKLPKLYASVTEEMAYRRECKEKKEGNGFLPFRNIIFLFFICAFCVVWISAQIDFEVKPFHDFGKKIEPVRMMKVGSRALISVTKSVWIAWALKFGYRISELVFPLLFKNPRNSFVWTGTCVFSLILGVLDILTTGNTFVWTYVMFYLMFVGIYYFTEQNCAKSFWFIFFIYIF